MAKLLIVTGICILICLGCGPSPKPGDESSSLTLADIRDDPYLYVFADKQPELIRESAPEYPPEALEQKIEGDVILQALIDKSGKVDKVKVVNCSNPGHGFEKAAALAAFGAVYRPAKKDKKSIPCWISYKVVFTLDD